MIRGIAKLMQPINMIVIYYWDKKRVLANGPWDLGSIPGRVIPKAFKNDTWYLLA